MKPALLITLLVFGGLSALYSRFKRIVAESGNMAEAGEGVNYADETESNDFFGSEVYEAEEAVANQSQYFTYESPEVKVEPLRSEQTIPVSDEEETPRFAFDLRQAIVYQAVLSNSYINL